MSMWFALWMGGGLALAEPPPEPVTTEAIGWEEVLQLLEDSPALSAERASVTAAEGERQTARGLPNPNFEYKGMYHARGVDMVDGKQEEFVLSQPLPVAGQHIAAVRQANRSLQAARFGYEAARIEHGHAVGYAFIDLLIAQERVGWLEETQERLRRVEQIVDRQIEAGVRSPYDRMRVQIEVSGLRAELGDARADQADAAGRLAALLGLGDRLPQAAGELPLPLHIDLDPERDSPWVRAAEEEAEAARAGLQLARRELIPRPEVGAGLFLVDGWASQALILQFNVDLPLLAPGAGRVKTAKAEAFGAERRAEAARRAIEAERRRAARSLQVRQEALERFEAEVITQLGDLHRMGEEAYIEAVADLMDLLDGIRTVQGQRMLHLDLKGDLARAQLDVLAAAGELAQR